MRRLAYVVVGCLVTCLWLHWVLGAAPRLPLVAASGGCSSMQCLGFSLLCFSCCRAMALGAQLQHVDSVVMERGLSCPVACRIFPDQVSNPRFLHWQMDSNLPNQQGGPVFHFFLMIVSSTFRKYLFCCAESSLHHVGSLIFVAAW